jgi:hypothetical protein
MKKLSLLKEGLPEFIGIEFATFRLKNGISEGSLLHIAERVNEEFLTHEKDLLGHVVLKGAGGLYADVVFATSQASAEAICAKWIANAVALEYIALIEEDSTNMTFWERIG